jgi:hypothetical protein
MKPTLLESEHPRVASWVSVLLSVGLFAGALGVAGCNGSSGVSAGQSGGSNQAPGTLVDKPHDPTLPAEAESLHFVVERSQHGQAGSLHVTSMRWGRLVQVVDDTGTLQQDEMVVGPDIPAVDPNSLSMDTNPVTDQTTVTIHHTYGTPEYLAAFQELDVNLVPIVPKSLAESELPPYSMVPRNCAMVVQFDDLLNTSTIGAATLKLLTGNPPIIPADARILPDQNHGDTADSTHYVTNDGGQTWTEVPGGDGIPEFHATRVIIDTTVSELEAARTNPPLPQNGLGLPASPTPNLPNVGLRVPTVQNTSVGQLSILRNIAGNGVSFSGSGPNDPSSPTMDVVRAMRSGNNSDASHGFLFDDVNPQILGTQAVTILNVNPPGTLTLQFLNLSCRTQLKLGDVIQQPGVFGQLTAPSGPPDATGTVTGVVFTIIHADTPGATLTLGSAQVSTPFDGVANALQEACFVRFTDIGQPPASTVALDSSIVLRFSEPMDPTTVRAFDSFILKRVQGTPGFRDYVPARVTPSADLHQFTLTPALPLTHKTQGTADTYYITVSNDATGPTDLAGNPVIETGFLPQVNFTTDPSASPVNSDGFALRFNAQTEANAGDPTAGPDFSGQFIYDLTNGQLVPRSVHRFGASCTRDKPVIRQQTAGASGGLGLQTPLVPLGAKMHSLWRYCDVGFGLLDEGTYNVDVEGLDWAPLGDGVISDTFHQFAIYLSHCSRLPDETKNPVSLYPNWKDSGIVVAFNQNILQDPPGHPQILVHDKSLGYVIDPSDRFLTTTSPPVTMEPYPLNRTLPVTQHAFYTWRDTSLLALGGSQSSPGAELQIVNLTTGVGVVGQPYPPGAVATVGLPLLMEFRCYPDDSAHGLNGLDFNIAINSSSLPAFRVFSAGGTNSSGTPIHKDPDSEQVATGGFNPNSNPPGQSTPGFDDVVYMGQMDLIVRVSRARSIYFNVANNSGPVTFTDPLVEPTPDQQPLGTQVVFAYRGAINATGWAKNDASKFDAYGEIRAPGDVTDPANVTPLNNDTTWKDSLSAINGSSFFQVRLSFIGNADTLLTPTLSALGFAYTH